MKMHPVSVFIIVSVLLVSIMGNSTTLGTTSNHMFENKEESISREEKQALQDTLNNFEQSVRSSRKASETKILDANAEKAWLDYRLFERELRMNYEAEDYLSKTKLYIKDSTQILIVKLKGLQSLDKKGLLIKDIIQNENYYLALLEKFEQSELPPRTYLYFENKIRKVCLDRANGKYQTSLILNLVGLVTIGGLTFGYIKNKKVQSSISDLSKQEKKVNDLILEGKTNKEIAGELFISISTVKTHTTNIYSKLGVKNRKELQANR